MVVDGVFIGHAKGATGLSAVTLWLQVIGYTHGRTDRPDGPAFMAMQGARGEPATLRNVCAL